MLLCHAELVDYKVDEHLMVYAHGNCIKHKSGVADDEEIQKQSRLVERLMEDADLEG